MEHTNEKNNLYKYTHYLLRGIYYNYIHTETGIAISRLFVFIVCITLIIYANYTYLFIFLILVIIIEQYSYSLSSLSYPHPSSWLNIWSEIRHYGDYMSHDIMDNISSDRLQKISMDENINKLTVGLHLNEKEGFELPIISRGDVSGREYRIPNHFIESSSREYSDTFFENKKCNNGIGSAFMFGSNELIGTSRTANLFSLYDFSGNLSIIKSNLHSSVFFKRSCFDYFSDCVYKPVKRSVDAGQDFRTLKTTIYDKITSNIMSIDAVLSKFKMNSNTIGISENNYIVNNIINIKAGTNFITLIDYKPVETIDNDFGTLIIEENKKTDRFKNRRLDVYNKVNQYKKRLNEIFTIWNNSVKDNNKEIGNINISDNMLQEIKEIVNYIQVIKDTNTIIRNEMNGERNIYAKFTPALITSKEFLPYGIVINTSTNTETLDINKTNDVFTIHKNINMNNLMSDYNLPDEQRYVYGISYFYNNIT